VRVRCRMGETVKSEMHAAHWQLIARERLIKLFQFLVVSFALTTRERVLQG
jgi:hypothetical protein